MKQSLYLSICLTFFCAALLPAQGLPWCGSEVSPYEAEHMSFLNDEIQAFTRQWIADKATRRDPPVNIPIKAHFFNNTSGVYGMDSATLVKAIDTLNNYMAPANLQFYICGPIDYLDLKINPVNTSIFYSKHPAFPTKFNFPYVVNVYFAAGLTDGSSTPTGVASSPLSGNRSIYIRNASALTPTLAHEMGHYFGLYHTFGKNNNCTRQDELVDGSNCAYSGDDVCDTPASPCLGITGEVDVATCTYTGTRLDPLGQPYNPLVNNIMDYGPGSCQTSFTDGQIARMHYFLTHVYTDFNCIQNFDSYCDAHALSSFKSWIESVQVGDQVRNTGNNGGYYLDPGTFATLRVGETYDLFLQNQSACMGARVKWRVYLDLNRDNDFLEKDELVYDGDWADLTEPVAAKLWIRPGATSGPTRMRVMMKFIDDHYDDRGLLAPMSCDVFKQGEVEDYTVVLEPQLAPDPYCKGYGLYNFYTQPFDQFAISNLLPVAGKFLPTMGLRNSYARFTDDTILLVRGRTYEVALGTNMRYSIDYNQNNLFDEPSQGISGIFTQWTPTLVPPDAALGNTRLRLRGGESTVMCDTLKKGWTEDYMVRIVDDPSSPLYPITDSGRPGQNDVWIENFTYAKILTKTGDNGGLGDFTHIPLKINQKDYPDPYAPNLSTTKGRSGTFIPNATLPDLVRFYPKPVSNPIPLGTYEIRAFAGDEVEKYTVEVVDEPVQENEDYAVPCNTNYIHNARGKIINLTLDGKVIKSTSTQSTESGCTQVNTGEQHVISFEMEPGDSTIQSVGEHIWYLFFDGNQDGLLDQATEILFVSPPTNQGLTIPFTLPENCNPGFVWMRLMGYLVDSVNYPLPSFCKGNTGTPLIGDEFGFYASVNRLRLNITQVIHHAKNGQVITSFATSLPVLASSSETWVSASVQPTMGSTSCDEINQLLTLDVLKNESLTDRQATITLQHAKATRQVTIYQLGRLALNVPDTIWVPGSVSTTPLTFSAIPGLSVYSLDRWLDLTIQANGGNYQISTLCQANPEFYTRTGQITLRNAAGRTQTITVVQEQGVSPFLYASENPVYLPNDTFGARLIPVYSNVDWTLSPSNLGNGWLTFVTAIDTVHVPDEPCLGFIYLRYKQNLTDTLRYSYVILKNSLIKDTVYIYQGPDISATHSPNETMRPLRCFPNPTHSGRFTVEFYAPQKESYAVEVFSLSGQLVARQEVAPGPDTVFRMDMDVPGLSNGMYLVRALSPSVGYMGKIVIQAP